MIMGGLGWILLCVSIVTMAIASQELGIDSPHKDDAGPKATKLAARRHINVFKSPNCGHSTAVPQDEAAQKGVHQNVAPIKKLATSCSWHPEHAVVGQKTKRKLVFSSRVCKGKLEVAKALFGSDGNEQGDKAVILSEALSPGQCITPASTVLPKMRAACRRAKIRCPQFGDESLTQFAVAKTSDRTDLIVGDAQGAKVKSSSSGNYAPSPAPCQSKTYDVTECSSGKKVLEDGDLNTWYVFSSPSVELKCYKGNVCKKNGHDRDYCTADRHFPKLKLGHDERIVLKYRVTCSKTCGSKSCRIWIKGVTQYGGFKLNGWYPKQWTACLDAYSHLVKVFSETKDDIHNSCS